MALDQTQIDTCISAGSEDDPDFKLKNLEQEVDLIKTSIKRLLIDIRERMTEFQSAGDLVLPQDSVSSAEAAAKEAGKAAMDAREAALDARESQLDAAEDTGDDPESSPDKGMQDTAVRPAIGGASLKNNDAPAVPAASLSGFLSAFTTPSRPEPEKPGLQKVFHLFTWTDKAVKKFGQDRLEIMLESYRVMGYLPARSKDEILGIMHLIPEDLGVAHTVSASEYVSELYSLRRILVPDDISLDRDMISVLMEQRRQAPSAVSRPAENAEPPRETETMDDPGRVLNRGTDLEWMNLPS